jgi:hypothetical protein
MYQLILASLLTAPPPPPSPVAQQLQAISKEYAKELAGLYKNPAESEEETDKREARYKTLSAPYAARCLKLAEDNPQDPAAFDALAWVLQRRNGGFSPDAAKTATILAHDYARDPRTINVCRSFARMHAPAAEKLLGAVAAENPSKKIQAAACLALGQMLAVRADDEAMHGHSDEAAATRKQAEEQFEKVSRDFADVAPKDVRGENAAVGELRELRTLSVGKTAPDIDGKDSSGKSFRLSDYRGKVVILDFWART